MRFALPNEALEDLATRLSRTRLPADILTKASWVWSASSRVGLSMTHTGTRRLLREQIDHGNDERESLARPGLGRGDHITPGQDRLYGLDLHGSRLRESIIQQVALQKSGDGKFRETFHS